MAVYLPEDIILFQIITRIIPTKLVIRLKCVSKQWNSFLMSDRFKQQRFNLLKDRHLELDQSLLLYSEEAATFYTIDCESLPYKAPCKRSLPQFEACSPKSMSILTSFHGLVCLRIETDDDYQIILWNPLTSEYKRLSKPPIPDYLECYVTFGRGYGLYYSSCEDDYKLLVVTQSGNAYIYSLKSDSWRTLNKKPPFQVTDTQWGPVFCLYENIYFQLHDTVLGSIRFDTTVERFYKIKTPPEYDDTNKRYFTTTTTIHKGCIHFCVKCNLMLYVFTSIELWKLNVDGHIWSKVVTYQFNADYDIHRLSPVHMMNNGNWLMIKSGRIFQVDMKKKKYTKEKDGHKRKGKNESKGNCLDEYKLYYSVRVGYPEDAKYTSYSYEETFVSPNQYMKTGLFD